MGIFSSVKNLFKKNDDKVYDSGLSKARNGFVSKLVNLNNKYHKICEDYLMELEDILIMADIGVKTVMNFMDLLRSRIKSENITDTNDLKEIIVDELFCIYVGDDILSNKVKINDNGISVILFVGVNGAGKTTTISKMASMYKDMGKKVMMVAADTFRAGAIEQLKCHSERVGCDFYSKEEGSDPASVCYEGINKAIDNNDDIVLIDTAGRLQNKVNLMNELEKINKVIMNLVNYDYETLLVMDATCGQNGISQAVKFNEVTNISGIVLTKMDGTSKGGIVLAIREEINIPVKYIGLGETVSDLAPFDIEKYIYGLFKDMM